MKVLYFHQHFTTRSGSTGTRSYEMAKALLEAGHDVHMVCGSFQIANTGLNGEFVRSRRTGIVDGIKITEFEIPYSNSDGFITRSLAFAKFAFRSVLLALKEPCDLVFATSTPLTAGIPGIAAKWLRRKRFVFEVRDLWPELPRQMGVITNPIVLLAMSILERMSYWSADACIGLSPGIENGIRCKASKNKPVAMIPNGCDLDLFQRAERTDLTLSENTIALFSGAHGRANGLDAVLDAAAVLVDRGVKNIRLEFVGEGSEKARLVERVASEGLSNCQFLPIIPKTKLADKLQNVDIGLMILDNVPAFYYGTSPNKFFDYLSAGLPVLNNYPGWVAEIINDYNVGIVVPPADPHAFADALIKLSSDKDARLEMSTRAVRCASERFDRVELAREFVIYLESVHEGKIENA